MSHDWIELAIAIAAGLFGCIAGTVGWVAIRIVGRMDDMEKGLESLTHKHGKEIRNTRVAVSYVAGQLKLPEPRYDD